MPRRWVLPRCAWHCRRLLCGRWAGSPPCRCWRPGCGLGPRLARDASLLLVATGLLLRLASGETSGLVALGGGACAWLLFNSRAMQGYMELVYAQRLYRAQSANRPGSAQRRLANQAAYRERKRRERSGRS